MTIQIYNTLGRQKETFEPVTPPQVKLYLCGPTVYDLLHIGNFRGVIFFNLVRNWLEKSGYSVTFVLNFTDIDDKIINRAAERGVDPLELSKQYIQEYQTDYARLGLTPHENNPKCTDHIPDMVTFIESLIKKGAAYEQNGSVFYDINSFESYGKLSGKQLEDLEAGHRVDPDPNKRNPLDFILWKPAKENEPSWDSPWGPGRPGWHIECSAMNHAILGEQIDIHGGGIDLIFPHHENEIAQSEAHSGHCFSKYWMHNNFIRFGDEKMSKSLGNVIKARDFMDTSHPEILKFLMLSVHYRSELNVDDSQVRQAISRLARIYNSLKKAKELAKESNNHNSDFEAILSEADNKITNALNDDFNTPILFACIFDVVRDFNQCCQQFKAKNPLLHSAANQLLKWFESYSDLLALFKEDPADFLKALDQILIRENNLDVNKVETLVQERNDARANKDYARSDAIRDELDAMGVELQDLPGQTVWEVKK